MLYALCVSQQILYACLWSTSLKATQLILASVQSIKQSARNTVCWSFSIFHFIIRPTRNRAAARAIMLQRLRILANDFAVLEAAYRNPKKQSGTGWLGRSRIYCRRVTSVILRWVVYLFSLCTSSLNALSSMRIFLCSFTLSSLVTLIRWNDVKKALESRVCHAQILVEAPSCLYNHG